MTNEKMILRNQALILSALASLPWVPIDLKVELFEAEKETKETIKERDGKDDI